MGFILDLLNLFLDLWWLWLFLLGPLLFFPGVLSSISTLIEDGSWASPRFLRRLAVATGGCLMIVGSLIYLELSPLENLLLPAPPEPPPPPPQIGENGLPVDTQLRFNFNPLPVWVDMFNEFALPLLKDYWSLVWLLWTAFIVVNYLAPEKRRRRKKSPTAD